MRKAIPLLAAIALALATAGVAIAQRNGDVTSYADLGNITSYAGLGNVTSYAGPENKPLPLGRWYWGKPHGQFCKGFGPMISVSEEFKDNVMNIAESDPDVQNLLDAGYENMCVKPIIEATVQGNGDVTIKATGAIVTLRRDWSRAFVQVDLEAGKVIKIVTIEMTVIKKS